MIVRPASDGIHLITQPDHAHLARRIMEHSVALSGRPRRDSILHAIGEHDNGWAEADAAPTVDAESGNVMDFVSAPLSVRQGAWPRGIARLADDPWAAALVAQHVLTVYDRYRSDSAWTAFFAEMKTARMRMLRAAAMPLADLEDDYAVCPPWRPDLSDLLHGLDRRAALWRIDNPPLRLARRRYPGPV